MPLMLLELRKCCDEPPILNSIKCSTNGSPKSCASPAIGGGIFRDKDLNYLDSFAINMHITTYKNLC